MKLKDIIGGIGEVASFIHPAIGGAIKAVNSFLPGDDQLPDDATPEQIHEKIAGLPPDVQTTLLEGEVKVDLAEINSEVSRYVAMTQADEQSTRPKIALIMAWCVVGVLLFYGGLIVYAIHEGVDVSEWWALFGIVLAIPAEVLRNYFGNLRKEQANRLAVPEKPLLDRFLGR